MKIDVKWSLKVLKILADVAFGLNVAFIVITLLNLTTNFIKEDYSVFEMRVNYPLHPVDETFQSPDGTSKSVTFDSGQSVMKMKVENTTSYIIYKYASFIIMQILIMTIILQVRKIVGSMKHNNPFKKKNVTRLKYIALCVLLFWPLFSIYYLIETLFISDKIVGYKAVFTTVGPDGMMYIVGAILIGFMALVFEHGFNLRKENEEFV